jgi:queuine/archaeosine tRNA-ribosyltransferase
MLKAGEATAQTLATIHNLTYYQTLIKELNPPLIEEKY